MTSLGDNQSLWLSLCGKAEDCLGEGEVEKEEEDEGRRRGIERDEEKMEFNRERRVSRFEGGIIGRGNGGQKQSTAENCSE